MRKFVTIGTVALLAAGALAVGVSADAGEPRQPSGEERLTSERPELPAAMERLEREADRLSATLDREAQALGRVRCTTLECLNRELTKLTRFAKQTAKRLNLLDQAWDDWYGCVAVVGVTQYGSSTEPYGYLYAVNNTDVITTTGLDYTESGSGIDDWVLVWTCDVE